MIATVVRWCGREAVVVPAAFLLLGVCFCYPLGFTDDLCPGEDTPGQYLPYMLRAFRPASPAVAGAWDPTQFTGLPESHSPVGRYYPVTVVLFSLAPPVRAFGLAVILHHALAGVGAYLLARGARLRAPAAGLAGVVFAFGGFLAFHRGHTAMHQAAAWLPWILWALDHYRRGGAWVWAAAAATFIGLHLLNGHTPTIALVGLACLLYVAYYTAVGTGSALGRGRFLLGAAAAGLLGVCAGLPQMLPMLEVARWSPFHEFRMEFLMDGYLKPRFLVGLASPWLLTDWRTHAQPWGFYSLTEFGVFYGLVALPAALAGLGVFRPRGGLAPAAADADAPGPSRREAGFWLTLGAVNLALMLGPTLGVQHVLPYVPVYNLFHMLVRHVLVVGLSLAWFAGAGVELLLRGGPARRRVLVGAAVVFLAGLVAAVAGALAMPGWDDGSPNLHYAPYWIALGGGVLSVLALAALTRPAMRPAALLLPLIAFGELWFHLHDVSRSPAPGAVVTDPAQFPETVRWLRAHGDGRPARCLKQTDIAAPGLCGVSSNGSCWGLSSLNAYSNSMPDTLARLLHMDMYGQPNYALVLGDERGLSAVGGAYVLAGDPLPPAAPGKGFRLADREQLEWLRDRRRCATPGDFRLTPPGEWAAALPDAPEGDYLADGELGGGPAHVEAAVLHGNRLDPLPGQAVTDGGRFSLRFHRPAGDGNTLLLLDAGTAPQVVRLDVWRLAPGGTAPDESPAETARLLREGVREAYPEAARLSDCVIYRNPQARGLATLVREVRPAPTAMAAADGALAGDLPVKELAYVAAPGGRSGDLTLPRPRTFSPGTADVTSTAPDDIRVRTETEGEGFLVLTVTRCAGWSATVDGATVPIHAVDGPLIGVCVPAGTHEVRVRFRPVLVWAGTAVAVVALGGAWTAVLIGWRRGRRAVRSEPPGERVPAAAA